MYRRRRFATIDGQVVLDEPKPKITLTVQEYVVITAKSKLAVCVTEKKSHSVKKPSHQKIRIQMNFI